MEFQIVFWWTNTGELRREYYEEDDALAELSQEHFMKLLEEGAFGESVNVHFKVHDDHVVATVKGVDLNLQKLFNMLSVYIIK